MRLILLLFIALFFANGVHAQDEYYGSLISRMQELNSSQFQRELHRVLSSYHVKRKGLPDLIFDKKPLGTRSKIHTPLSYDNAKMAVFNILDSNSRPDDMVEFQLMHCEEPYTTDKPWGISLKDLALKLGFNIEHLWPQSRMLTKKNDPEKYYKLSDLHHIFAARADINHNRSNYQFADVGNPTQLGTDINRLNPTELYYESTQKWKPVLARALMYMSVRYQISIDPVELSYLRIYNQIKPTDEEKLRNELVEELQFNRNPFIDHPEWADKLSFQW